MDASTFVAALGAATGAKAVTAGARARASASLAIFVSDCAEKLRESGARDARCARVSLGGGGAPCAPLWQRFRATVVFVHQNCASDALFNAQSCAGGCRGCVGAGERVLRSGVAMATRLRTCFATAEMCV